MWILNLKFSLFDAQQIFEKFNFYCFTFKLHLKLLFQMDTFFYSGKYCWYWLLIMMFDLLLLMFNLMFNPFINGNSIKLEILFSSTLSRFRSIFTRITRPFQDIHLWHIYFLIKNKAVLIKDTQFSCHKQPENPTGIFSPNIYFQNRKLCFSPRLRQFDRELAFQMQYNLFCNTFSLQI